MRYVADDVTLVDGFWQVLIGVCVVLATVVSAHRLLMRGPSRMSRAIVVAASALVGIILISILVSIA